MSNETKRAAATKFLRSFDAAVDERSAEPLVEPVGPTDPREIARLVAKQEKRQKRTPASMLDEMDMLDDSIDSDELDSGDDLLSKSDETEDFNGGFGDSFDSDLSDDLRDADDERGKSGKKSRDGEKTLFDLAEAIVREDASETLEKTFGVDENVATKIDDAKTSSVSDDSETTDLSRKPKKRTRVKEKDDETGDVKKNDADVVAESDETNEKTETKKNASARKSTSKKEKTPKNAASADVAKTAQETGVKSKTKSRAAKIERNIDDESATKIKEIEQKKPR